MLFRKVGHQSPSNTVKYSRWYEISTSEVKMSVYWPGDRVRNVRPTLGILIKLDNPFLFLPFVGTVSPTNRRTWHKFWVSFWVENRPHVTINIAKNHDQMTVLPRTWRHNPQDHNLNTPLLWTRISDQETNLRTFTKLPRMNMICVWPCIINVGE